MPRLAQSRFHQGVAATASSCVIVVIPVGNSIIEGDGVKTQKLIVHSVRRRTGMYSIVRIINPPWTTGLTSKTHSQV